MFSGASDQTPTFSSEGAESQVLSPHGPAGMEVDPEVSFESGRQQTLSLAGEESLKFQSMLSGTGLPELKVQTCRRSRLQLCRTGQCGYGGTSQCIRAGLTSQK